MTKGASAEAVVKAAVYLFVQLTLGLVVTRRLVGGAAPLPALALDSWLSRVAVAVAAALVGAVLLRAVAHTASGFGAAGAWSAENLWMVAVESRWGASWQWHLIVAAVLLVSAAIAWLRPAPLTRSAYLLAALAVVSVLPLLGHAGGSADRHLVHSVHLLGSGAWVGTLGVLALMSLASTPSAALADAVRRFAPWALSGAATLAASGFALALLYLPEWAAWTGTPYGRLVLVKLLFAGLVAACGGLNWRRARTGRPPRRLMIGLEYALALAVTGLTAVLTETEHP